MQNSQESTELSENLYPAAEQVLPNAFKDPQKQLEVFSELHQLISEHT